MPNFQDRTVLLTGAAGGIGRVLAHPYGPAKAALKAMSAGHASEFAGSGITVNVVVPGGPARRRARMAGWHAVPMTQEGGSS